MEKQEFLEKLRTALSGRLAAEVVTDTVHYYEDYINTETRLGREEQEVMTSLGDPRLIARTIIETKGGRSGAYSEQNGRSGRASSEKDRTEAERPQQYRPVPGWVWLVLILILAALVISAVFRFLSAFWPLIVVMAVVLFLVKVFRDWIN